MGSVFASSGDFYSVKYASVVFRLKCSRDILWAYPNFKEWTEACGMFYAFVTLVGGFESFGDLDAGVLVIGDGRTPRCGIMFAYRTPCKVVSVDPNLSDRSFELCAGVDRLMLFRKKGEGLTGGDLPATRDIVIILPHSHWKGELNCDLNRYERIAVISMPCCVRTTHIMKRPPDFSYRDHGVTSPKNEIEFYLVKGEWPVNVGLFKRSA